MSTIEGKGERYLVPNGTLLTGPVAVRTTWATLGFVFSRHSPLSADIPQTTRQAGLDGPVQGQICLEWPVLGKWFVFLNVIPAPYHNPRNALRP